MMTSEEFLAEGHERVDMDALARLQVDPRFPGVMRRLMADVMDVQDGKPQIRAGAHRQYLVCILTFFLHARPAGLTVSSLRDLCAEAGYPRAIARAMLAYLRFLKYVEPMASSGDRRERRFAPTDDLKGDFHRRMSREVAIIAEIDPDAARAAPRMADYDFFLAFMTSFGAQLIDGRRRSTPDPTGLAMFSARTGGFPILFYLLLGTPEDGPMPPTAPIAFTVSELARFGKVSRTQVIRLLRDAEAAGMIGRIAEGELVVLPKLADDLKLYFAAIIWGYAAFARWALKRAD